MRLGVVDVGSNTVRLVIAERDGEMPLPVYTSKRRLRLAERAAADGRLGRGAIDRLVEAVGQVVKEAADWGVSDPFVFATSAVRAAPNREEVLAEVQARTGMDLFVMSGQMEAELSFLAARQWMGWQAGAMVLLDIGGGRSRSLPAAAPRPISRSRCRSGPVGSPGSTWPKTTFPTPRLCGRCGGVSDTNCGMPPPVSSGRTHGPPWPRPARSTNLDACARPRTAARPPRSLVGWCAGT